MKIKTVHILTETSSGSSLNRSSKLNILGTMLWALVIFILVNIVLSFADYTHEQHTGAYISCDCLTSTYKTAKPTPDIVLFGSSVMRKPFFLADCQHTNYITDYDHYCWSQTLQNILRHNGLEGSKVFNFAIDGEMVSDAFLINSKLLQGPKTPKWIVYGITPRDLIDNLFSNETRTPIFDRLFTIKDVWSSQSPLAIGISEKLNLLMEKSCFLYDKRKQIQNMFVSIYTDIKEQGFPKTISKLIKPQSNGEPYKPLTDQEAWEKSIEEYHKRYSTFNKMQFDKQSVLLTKFCEESRRKGINILLVNMPLTKENIDLLPKGVYRAYSDAIVKAGQLPGVNLLDLQNLNEFPKAAYCDTAHLNQQGAHRLEMIISDNLVSLDKQLTNSPKMELINDQYMTKTVANKQLNSNRKIGIVDGLASWWLTKAYYADSKAPEVVILGDSRFGALYGADAYVYNKTIDITGDHRCHVLERDVHGLLEKDWRVFVGALPRVSILDLLTMSQSLFSSEYKPKIVVLGFSPEDFVEQSDHSTQRSEASAFFSEYGGHDSALAANNALTKMQTREYSFKRDAADYIKGSSPLLLGKPFERLCPGEISINSGDGYAFYDDTDEYRKIYTKPFTGQLKSHLQKFDLLLSYLARQNIKVVAFDLPLYSRHKQLLTNNLCRAYVQGVMEVCRKNNADYIDLVNDWQAFNDKDFIDSTHLNLPGGLKLTRPIAFFVANKFHWKTFDQIYKSGCAGKVL